MIPPQSRPDLPAFGVKRGSTVRVHLGFTAKSVSVSFDKRAVRTKLDEIRRIASWSTTRGGVLTVGVDRGRRRPLFRRALRSSCGGDDP